MRGGRRGEKKRGLQKKQLGLPSLDLSVDRCLVSYLCSDRSFRLFGLRNLPFPAICRQVVLCDQRAAYLSQLYPVVVCRLVSWKTGPTHLPSLFYSYRCRGNRAVLTKLSACVAVLWRWILEVPGSESSVSKLPCARAAGGVHIE